MVGDYDIILSFQEGTYKALDGICISPRCIGASAVMVMKVVMSKSSERVGALSMALGRDDDQGKKESTACQKIHPILISLSVDLTGRRITS